MDTLVYGLLTKEIKETIGASYVSSISSSDTNNVYLDVTYKREDASTDTVRLTFPKPLNGANGINGVDGEDGLSIVSASFVGNDIVFTRSDSSTLVIVGAKTLLTPNIESKQDLLVSGNNIKTINGNDILGSGNLVISGGGGGAVEWSNVLNKPSDIFYTSTMNADSISTTTSTNKFTTQSDINKLATVEENAEQNNISDINATALTNNGDTSIHFHSADRIRSNHTGTQPASTISDFNTAVASSPSVTANTSKVSFPEAPNDGSYYARKSQGWSPVLYTENTIFLENPTVPNVASEDSSTKVANTTFVKNNPTTAKAWVNFNGVGALAIRSSYNVSSITDRGAGIYDVNFVNPMKDTTYSAFFGVSDDNMSPTYAYESGTGNNKTINKIRMSCYTSTNVTADRRQVSCIIFGN